MNSCGIDEAGRGPMLGPLVIAGVLATSSQIKQLKKYYSVGENRKQDYSSYQALKDQIPMLKELLGLDYDLTSNQKLASMMSKHSAYKTINELEQGMLIATPFAKFGYADEK